MERKGGRTKSFSLLEGDWAKTKFLLEGASKEHTERMQGGCNALIDQRAFLNAALLFFIATVVCVLLYINNHTKVFFIVPASGRSRIIL